MKRFAPWVAAVSLLAVSAGFRAEVTPGAVGAFSRLPVLHGGRIKPMDSIARSSLLVIRGKQTLRVDGRKMSASEWLLELVSRSQEADHRKIFRIDDPDVLSLIGRRSGKERYFTFDEISVGLRDVETQAQRAGRVDGKLQTRFEKAVVNLYNRISKFHSLKNTLRSHHEGTFTAELDAFEAALAAGRDSPETLPFLGRYRSLAQNAHFRPLPPSPGRPKEDWSNVGEGLLETLRAHGGGKIKVSAEIRAYAGMMDTFVAGDGDAFARLAAELENRMKELYPEQAKKARHEEFFNRFAPFAKGMTLYVLAFLAVCLSWLVGGKKLRKAAYFLLLAGFAIHCSGLFFRMVLQGRPPVTNLYSSAVFVGWGAVLMGIVLERIHRRGLATLVSSLTGFCSLIIAHHLASSGDTMEMMQAVLDSNFWLATHVITITIGYSSTFLAGMLAHAYIFGRLFKRLSKEGGRALTQMTYGVICFSLFWTFIGTVLGGIWADQSWGRFWGWDPKENGALLIVLWLSLILHARWSGYIRERGIMVMAVFGNIVTATSWFGVNMLGIGLHSYGFMDKAAFWFAFFVATQLVVMGLAYFDRPSSSAGSPRAV